MRRSVRSSKSSQFDKAKGDLKKTSQDLEQITTWMNDRYYWADVLTELRRVLIRVEEATKKKVGADTSVWIEQMAEKLPESAGPGGQPGVPEPPTPASPAKAAKSNVAVITLLCRGVSLARVAPSANVPDTDIVYAMENELKGSPLFDPKETQLSPQINVDEATGTFTFGVTLAIKRPLKL